MKRAWCMAMTLVLLATFGFGGQALAEVICCHQWIEPAPVETEVIWEDMGMSHNKILLRPMRCINCGVEIVTPYNIVEGHEFVQVKEEHLSETGEHYYQFACVKCGRTDERIVPCEEGECCEIYLKSIEAPENEAGTTVLGEKQERKMQQMMIWLCATVALLVAR